MRIDELWQALESGAGSKAKRGVRTAGGWLLRLARPDAGHPLFLAVERSTGRRALLLRATRAAIPARREWPACRGLEVFSLLVDDIAHLGVVLKEPRYADVFTALAEDLARRVADAGTTTEQVRALLGGLARWQKFLAAGAEGLNEEAQRGLWGELHFLRDGLLPVFAEEISVTAWQGHRAAHQDFLLPAGAVEVKTTSGKAPHIVRITSERQLDGRDLPALYLRHLALTVREGAGETLPAMVASLRARLFAAPQAIEHFEVGLLAAGYRDADAWRYEARGYSVREANDFTVSGRFPRLTERDLPAGIGDVRYALSLDACGSFLLPPNALLAALAGTDGKRNRRTKKAIGS
ncbi:MAG: PD-(D/E)XK motif protein [Chthoniobacter sp.]|nr:PD-(D/E)XK motif protein [Chthoniobacter sp.]